MASDTAVEDMSEEDLVMHVRDLVADIGSLRRAAKEWKISPTYLCFVMSGKTRPGESILKAIGWERAPVRYRRRREDSDGR